MTDIADTHLRARPGAGGREGPAARPPWAVFFLLAVIQFMVILDGSMVVSAIPSIQRDLDFSPSSIAWVLDAYMLAYGGFLLVGGKAADTFGRRRLFSAGLVIFTVASLACALSADSWQLIAARVAQGLGAALVSPAAFALVTDLFEEGPVRNRAMVLWGGMNGVGGAAGVLLGGLFSAVAWQLAFLINIPVGALVLLLALRRLPKGRPTATGGIDLTGALACTGGLTLVIYAAVRGGAQGWLAPATLLELAGAAALFAAFALRQRTARTPLVPRVLFRMPNVVLGNAANLLAGAILLGGFTVASFYLQQARGLGPVPAAALLVPPNVAALVASQLSGRLITRIGAVGTLLTTLLVQAAAAAWWALALDAHAPLLTAFVLPSMVWCAALGAALPSLYVVCTGGLTEDVAGSASGWVQTTMAAGNAIGAAVLTAVAAEHTTSLASPTGADALTAGYATALWVAAGLAVAGTLLTVRLRLRREVPATA
ncbi:MFS transporter [Streptomyces sp. N2A]|uniref:MFS transporter n=1 Tax=Streptomyces sp. N2A TaxID=3073936 RepID=UPI0028703A88|nr:MFS transporter [Streptomyces sp. N2A]